MSMESIARLRGVLAPAITPFTSDLEVDLTGLLLHSERLLKQGAGLAIFGTNSEANSLSFGERLATLNFLAEAGLPMDRTMPGTGCCNLPETVELTRVALAIGAAGVLVLPPFFYKRPSDDGLFAYFSELIERVGSDRLALYLYHIPGVSQVPITPALVERLLKRYPGVVAGLKDSSGEVPYLDLMLGEFSGAGFDVFCASETLLVHALSRGGAGCISATVNVNAAAIRATFDAFHSGSEAQHQLLGGITAVRRVFEGFPLIPAMKRFLARQHERASLAIVRPPLTQLSPREAETLDTRLQEVDFEVCSLSKRSSELATTRVP